MGFVFLEHVEGDSAKKLGCKRSLDFQQTNRGQSDIQSTPLDGSIEV
jgi:hypothetical protein